MVSEKEKITEYDDLYTKDDFIMLVNEGCFIDYDGYGRYSDGIYVFRGGIVYPSDITTKGWNNKFSHIVWYNK